MNTENKYEDRGGRGVMGKERKVVRRMDRKEKCE